MHYSEKDLMNLDRITRLNIINSITGIKPGNLVGTKSNDGKENLAIMSSAVHLGSAPALIGLIFRPQLESPRDTYLNIQENNYYTMNHIPTSLTKHAHYTSAKFEPDVNEFERCQMESDYQADFHAPFLKGSPIQIALEKVQEIPIELNNTILMIGKVKHIFINNHAINEAGQVDLEQAGSTGISGLDHYYKLIKIANYPYAHVDSVPETMDS